jgi:hypothetical protein
MYTLFGLCVNGFIQGVCRNRLLCITPVVNRVQSSLQLPRQLVLPNIRLLLIINAIVVLANVGTAQVQPELSKFAPLDQHDLVDHFTGGFRYSVPLMEVPGPKGGYPITLTYASGIAPDEDASWVGLGWTLSPGAIVRQMRGVPDDFDGSQSQQLDQITTVQYIEPQKTYGLGIAGNYEFFGLDTSVGTGLNFGLTGYFDSYRGFGINNTVGVSMQTKGQGTSASIGLNIGEDSLEGAHIGANASLSLGDSMRFGADLSYDAGRGLPALSFSGGAMYQRNQFLVATTGNIFNYLGYAKPAALPGTGRETKGMGIKVNVKAGGEVFGNYMNGMLNGFYNFEELRNHLKRTPAVGYLHLEQAIRSADLTDPDRSASDDDLTGTFALDFNRERDGPIYDQSPNLALPVLTNDLFIVSGRDITGTFRAYRNDNPAVFDPLQDSEITGGAFGVDVGFGDFVKVGLSGELNHSETVIGRWRGGGVSQPGQPNNVDTLLGALKKSFKDDPTGFLERTYFKFIGEPSFAQAPESSGVSPIAPKLTGKSISDSSIASLVMANSVVPPFFYVAEAVDAQNSPVTRTPPVERVPRATLIQAFTNSELRTMANALPDFAAVLAIIDANASTRTMRQNHPNHIGGFRITVQNGTRYVYGLAVYNTNYEEHKFSVDRKKLCPASGYCTIVNPPTPTATTGDVAGAAYDYKVAGSEEMLEIKKLSPYASSYLLTAVLGPDYIDSDGIPGPSDGDVGYWVKFNYVLATPDFKWRIPYLGASFVRGPDNGRYVVGTERLSDKGYFTFGSRETWYLASVETATHKAFMCTDRIGRRDAISAVDPAQIETPTAGFERPWKLTSVQLYPKSALSDLTMDPSTGCPNGTPLIEAHLDYEGYNTSSQRSENLSLANLSPNAQTGKLTLKRVYFTHLSSTRGKLSPYVFDYDGSDVNHNPDYHDGERDRWNNYQVPPTPPQLRPTNGAPLASPPVEDRMAWTDQSSAGHTDQSSPNLLDKVAGAWSLRKVTEPTGRTIVVQYEAGDYAYVQDKPAMRFFPLTSVNATLSDSSTQQPGSLPPPNTICPAVIGQVPNAFDCGSETHRRVYFRLECDDQGAHCDTDKTHYVDVCSDCQILFKIRVALRYDASSPSKWQTISGYANVIDTGTDGNNIGWVELAPVHSNYPLMPDGKGLDYHPFAHAAWQYLRLQQPELSHDGGINGDPDGDALREALSVMTLVDVLPEIIQSLTGVYPGWLLRGWGQVIDLDNSWIRLKDPNGIKKGGAPRVRQLTVSDDWGGSTNGKAPSLTTGYVYIYRLEDNRSSGVAAYEPMVGGDENPLRQAKSFTDQVLLSSDYNLFAELPIGEALYPAPSVGYSRVVRRSLAAQADLQYASIRTHPTSSGPTAYEYYTARDFPVQSSETLVSKMRLPFPQVINIPLLGTITISSLTASQGYLTIINDMHGKPKREASYQYTDHFASDPALKDYVLREDPVKETIYYYKANGGIAGNTFKLDNSEFSTLITEPDPIPKPPVTKEDATKTAVLAEESDYVVDLRQNRTESWDGGINLNVDTFLILYIPIPVPVPMPSFGYSLTETKTVVTSRVVHQSGIIDSVSVRQGSARVTTKNDYYDPLTGGAILSEVDNTYGKSVFSYNVPGRWSYPRMGAAYLDVGRSIDLTSGTFDASKLRLTVPAAFISPCPDPTQQNAQGAIPGTQQCLPVGSELAVPSSGGGIHITLLGSDNAAHTTVFGVDGDPTGAFVIGLANPLSHAVVVRSGNRNLLTETTDSFRALSNPLTVREGKSCHQATATAEGGGAVNSRQSFIHGVLDARHTTYGDYWPVSTDGAVPTEIQNEDYKQGIRGVFRTVANYFYRADRSSGLVESRPVDLTSDGTYDVFLFGPGNTPKTCEAEWLPSLTHTRYSPAGLDIENVNALGIHSTSQYGAEGTLPFAIASNATYDEIGFEGFETNGLEQSGSDPVRVGEGHIEFAETTRCVLFKASRECANRIPIVSITSELAHTGKRSLRVVANQAFDQSRLHLRGNTTYLLSGWVSLGAPGSTAADVTTYAQTQGSSRTIGLEVSYQPSGSGAPQVLATLTPDGPIIEGWQRIEGTFLTPTTATDHWVEGIHLTFLNSGPSPGGRQIALNQQPPAYFDDIRVQPEDASLVGFVYDLDTRRITAQLDENNFATFYRYTPDGKVDLVRRETVRGILSQQEGRFHTRERP